jgi:glycosyltransferase involved in cell wall biosynthesis
MNDGPDSPAVSVIVPLFNEEENVPILQSELTSALATLDYEIIFVDDESSDGTVERIAPGPRIRVLRFEKNAGQSAALYAGLRSARGRTAVLIDGDLQNDPADILQLLAEIERGAGSGLRISRAAEGYVLKGHESHRQFCSQNSRRTGFGDTDAPLKAMRRECISALPIQRDASIHSALVKGAGYRLVEIPVIIARGNMARAIWPAIALFARPWTCSVCAGSLPVDLTIRSAIRSWHRHLACGANGRLARFFWYLDRQDDYPPHRRDACATNTAPP